MYLAQVGNARVLSLDSADVFGINIRLIQVSRHRETAKEPFVPGEKKLPTPIGCCPHKRLIEAEGEVLSLKVSNSSER